MTLAVRRISDAHSALMLCLLAGSAHAVLGPYWCEVLQKRSLKARQCSRRGADLTVDVDSAGGVVVLTAPTVIVSKGCLYV